MAFEYSVQSPFEHSVAINPGANPSLGLSIQLIYSGTYLTIVKMLPFQGTAGLPRAQHHFFSSI